LVTGDRRFHPPPCNFILGYPDRDCRYRARTTLAELAGEGATRAQVESTRRALIS